MVLSIVTHPVTKPREKFLTDVLFLSVLMSLILGAIVYYIHDPVITSQSVTDFTINGAEAGAIKGSCTSMPVLIHTDVGSMTLSDMCTIGESALNSSKICTQLTGVYSTVIPGGTQDRIGFVNSRTISYHLENGVVKTILVQETTFYRGREILDNCVNSPIISIKPITPLYQRVLTGESFNNAVQYSYECSNNYDPSAIWHGTVTIEQGFMSLVREHFDEEKDYFIQHVHALCNIADTIPREFICDYQSSRNPSDIMVASLGVFSFAHLVSVNLARIYDNKKVPNQERNNLGEDT